MRMKAAFITCLIAVGVLLAAYPAEAQDWFKTGTGLGVSKARVAAPDLATSPDAAKLESTFHNVLWNDLEYSGILDMVSQSFYPLKVPSQPGDLTAPDAQGKPAAQDWANAPANTYMLAYGNMVAPAFGAAQALAEEGIHVDFINLRWAKPLDDDAILESVRRTGRVIVMEEGVVAGGVGSAVLT